MNPATNARFAIMQALNDIHRIAVQLHDSDIPDEVATHVGITFVMVSRYMRTTLTIINQPNVIAPVMGRRCIFY